MSGALCDGRNSLLCDFVNLCALVVNFFPDHFTTQRLRRDMEKNYPLEACRALNRLRN